MGSTSGEGNCQDLATEQESRWCRRGDLNPYALAGTSPSSWRVCLFRHSDAAGNVSRQGRNTSATPGRGFADGAGTTTGRGTS